MFVGLTRSSGTSSGLIFLSLAVGPRPDPGVDDVTTVDALFAKSTAPIAAQPEIYREY